MDLERTGDGARHVVPRHIDDARARAGERRESCREEIEMVRAAAGTLVDDLDKPSTGSPRRKRHPSISLTIAVTVLPP